MAERGSTEWSSVEAILDEGFLAQVAFCAHGQPFVIPMLYGRRDRTLMLHGAAAGRLLSELGGGLAICVGVTLVDGLVLARSAFNHSMNYRSVVAFGTARAIEAPRERIAALRVISEHLLPGRWADVRGPSRQELAQTTVLEMSIDEASSKIRRGPVSDDAADYRRETWAGLLPLTLQAEAPEPDAPLPAATPAPDYLLRAAGRFRRASVES